MSWLTYLLSVNYALMFLNMVPDAVEPICSASIGSPVDATTPHSASLAAVDSEIKKLEAALSKEKAKLSNLSSGSACDTSSKDSDDNSSCFKSCWSLPSTPLYKPTPIKQLKKLNQDSESPLATVSYEPSHCDGVRVPGASETDNKLLYKPTKIDTNKTDDGGSERNDAVNVSLKSYTLDTQYSDEKSSENCHSIEASKITNSEATGKLTPGTQKDTAITDGEIKCIGSDESKKSKASEEKSPLADFTKKKKKKKDKISSSSRSDDKSKKSSKHRSQKHESEQTNKHESEQTKKHKEKSSDKKSRSSHSQHKHKGDSKDGNGKHSKSHDGSSVKSGSKDHHHSKSKHLSSKRSDKKEKSSEKSSKNVKLSSKSLEDASNDSDALDLADDTTHTPPTVRFLIYLFEMLCLVSTAFVILSTPGARWCYVYPIVEQEKTRSSTIISAGLNHHFPTSITSRIG